MRGYAARTVVNELRQVARLSCWLQASGLQVTDLSRARVEDFLAARRAAGQRATGPGLLCLLDVLRSVGALEAEAPALRVDSPTDALLVAFRGYLLQERGLVPGTADAYVAYARRFWMVLSARIRLLG